MPWGVKRFRASGQTYFVTFWCYRRRPWFTTPIAMHVFEAGLEGVRRSFEVCVYGYVVMAEQVHLADVTIVHSPLAKSGKGRGSRP